MSRLDRLSDRAYGRLTPEQKRAVDTLRYGNVTAAARGEAKTVLGWRRTAEETRAYARKLIADGLTASAVANRLGVDRDHLQRLLKKVSTLEKQPRKPFAGVTEFGITDKSKGLALPRLFEQPDPRPGRVMYASDPFAYDLDTELRRAGAA